MKEKKNKQAYKKNERIERKERNKMVCYNITVPYVSHCATDTFPKEISDKKRFSREKGKKIKLKEKKRKKEGKNEKKKDRKSKRKKENKKER